MSSVLLETPRGILNSVMRTAHFPENFNSVFNKKKYQNYFAFVQHSMLKKE